MPPFSGLRPKLRPGFLDFRTALHGAGELTDSPAGYRKYGEYLEWHATDGPAGKNKSYISLSKGWALGTPEFKSGLVKDHALAAATRAWESGGAREIREQAWEELLEEALTEVGRQRSQLTQGVAAQPWKVAIGTFLKEKVRRPTAGWPHSLASVARLT